MDQPLRIPQSAESYYESLSPNRVGFRRRSKRIAILCGGLVCLALFMLPNLSSTTRDKFRWSESSPTIMHSDPLDASLLLGESVPVVDSLQVEVSPSLNGRPTNSFRDNLRPEVSYITSWPGGGWTNQVMSMMNLIYLGLITDRIIIIPEFMPTHFAYDRPPLPFGDVFDIPRLVKELGQQVLEWREVKDQNSPVVDDIGCWSVWLSVQTGEKVPRGGQVTRILNLDVSYTKTPAWVKMKPNYVHDQHASVWGLAKLAFPTTREASLVPALPSPKHNVSLEPDEHLLCYDFLYYVAAHEPFEITKSDYSPAWRRAGKHMRWAPALEKLGDDCVRRTLGVKGDEPTPPFISVHMRHGDFKSWCPKGVAPNECFAPLSAVDRRVREVQAEVLQRKGIEVKHVIATSDEKNSTWWDQVAELGWRTPDHSQLEDVYGGWDSVLIDAVVQSQGVGYVGTERSTMSRLAGRRVQDWNDGPIKYVKWGRPGADD